MGPAGIAHNLLKGVWGMLPQKNLSFLSLLRVILKHSETVRGRCSCGVTDRFWVVSVSCPAENDPSTYVIIIA